MIYYIRVCNIACTENIDCFSSEIYRLQIGEDCMPLTYQIFEAFATSGDFQNIFDKFWLLFSFSSMSTLELLSMHIFSSCTSRIRRTFC